MKVILYKAVPDLGEEDSLVDVSEGYARNYLLPKKLAATATPAALASLEKRRAANEKKLAEKKAEFEAMAQKLSELELSIATDAGEGGKLFGSVTTQDIAVAIQSAAQVEIDKKRIELAEPIRLVGEYSVPVKLFQDITAQLKVKVTPK
ncbi:50S ribosomal protein L9 [Candidatus Margulisiibacteriota bacterium]